jgi:hypothetical protein
MAMTHLSLTEANLRATQLSILYFLFNWFLVFLICSQAGSDDVCEIASADFLSQGGCEEHKHSNVYLAQALPDSRLIFVEDTENPTLLETPGNATLILITTSTSDQVRSAIM